MTVHGNRVMNGVVLLIALVLLNVLYATDAQAYMKSHMRMQKLCSKKLSDAMQIVCRERGYNEPFSDSNEEPGISRGPGLVEECCYHQCTIEQLEQYCMPLPGETQVDSRDDVIDLSYTASLPHSTTKDLLEQHSQTEYAGDAIKRSTQQR